MNFFKKFFFFKGGASSLEHFVVRGLASTCWADEHETVAHQNSVVELYDFKIEVFSVLNHFFSADLINSLEQVTVLLIWFFNSWEKIGNDVLKKGKIIS